MGNVELSVFGAWLILESINQYVSAPSIIIILFLNLLSCESPNFMDTKSLECPFNTDMDYTTQANFNSRQVTTKFLKED